ncbi:hypothetical protein ILUMI_05358 [Ignelater luminosus]|uniref:Uncharacterized protein n=1 Tax=Ignelater luminosus TaxID=2038154 RepID=A0A8K0D7V3_IGNLU|nr:hypothetical protein ILUMI_05358 [Ignelater luminosus]
MYKTVILLVSLSSCTFGLNLPATFKQCKRDGNINACMKEAIQDALPKIHNGIPEFNIPVLEPLEVTSITIGEGKSAVNVVQNYKNAKLYGLLVGGTIDNVELKLDGSSSDWIMEGIIPEVKIIADYEFNGKVLLLPIVGSGNSETVFKNVKFRLEMHGEASQKNGAEYGAVTKATMTLLPEHITFNFENLFNGDATLGSQMNQVLNDNWKEVWEDVRGGYEEALGQIIQNVVNKLIRKIPTDQLFPL